MKWPDVIAQESRVAQLRRVHDAGLDLNHAQVGELFAEIDALRSSNRALARQAAHPIDETELHRKAVQTRYGTQRES